MSDEVRSGRGGVEDDGAGGRAALGQGEGGGTEVALCAGGAGWSAEPCPAAAAIASDRRRVAVPEVGLGDEVDMGEAGGILSFSFQRLPALVSRRFRQLDDGAAQPFEDFGPVRRRTVAQEHESAAGRRVREMIVEQA